LAGLEEQTMSDLEHKFGPELDAMDEESVAELLERYPKATLFLRQRLKRRRGPKAGTLRLILLDQLAEEFRREQIGPAIASK
jgi:hypothetical protein